MAELADGTVITIRATGSNELRELWGGASSVRLPQGFLDASDFRPIPDNQEVYIHTSTDQSIIFELTEPVDAHTFVDIGKLHLQSLLADNDAEAPEHFRVLSVKELTESHLPDLRSSPSIGPFMACYVKAEMLVSKFKEQARNRVLLHLAIIRLNDVKTDLLITLNHPVQLNPESSSAGSELAAIPDDVFVTLVKSFRLHSAFLELFG